MTYHDNELLSDGLSRYYKSNGLPSGGGLDDRWARYKFGPIQAIAFPNFKLRNEALLRHDIHHIMNNLDTSPKGEGLIAAWELGSGCGKFWISWFMESQALWWGILLSPRQALAFFALGRRSLNYFQNEMGPDLNSKTVGEIRAKMLPHTSLDLNLRDIIRFSLVALLGIFSMFIFIPIATFFTVIGFLIGVSRLPKR